MNHKVEIQQNIGLFTEAPKSDLWQDWIGNPKYLPYILFADSKVQFADVLPKYGIEVKLEEEIYQKKIQVVPNYGIYFVVNYGPSMHLTYAGCMD